ncbi:MAG: response regulator transcription factor [Planctomycetes bacterium]|nr:response regulator transcription factor [Planctomycetota bacterium]
MTEQTNGKYKIMVVDDDPDIVATILVGLQNLNQQVLTARDGLQALDVAEQQDPDILVLDLMLPRRGGFQVLQRLKGKASMKGKRPLICMVTGNEGMRHQEFAEQNGVDEYLRKPFAIPNLVEIVQGFIKQLDKGIENAK